jgi:hypothetical protein
MIANRRRRMPDFSLFPQFIAALTGGWFTAMSGAISVIGFIAALIMALKKRPLAFGSLLTLAGMHRSYRVFLRGLAQRVCKKHR